MTYLHKSLRAQSGGKPPAGLAGATLAEQPLAHPESLAPATVQKACPRIFDMTWALILGHRQFIRAGVPGCSCGISFDSHATFIADHAQHQSDEVVRQLLAFVLTTLESGGAQDLQAAIASIRAMLPPVPALEAVTA